MKRWWLAVLLGMCGAYDASAQPRALVFNPLATPRRETQPPPEIAAAAPMPVSNPLAMPFAGPSGYQTAPTQRMPAPANLSSPGFPFSGNASPTHQPVSYQTMSGGYSTPPSAPTPNSAFSHAPPSNPLAAMPAPFRTEAEARSYGALTAEGCAHGRCGRSERPWRETFAWEDGRDACSVCGPLGRVWGSVDYIYWWTGGQYLTPLVTTAPLGTPEAVAGVLGVASTQVRFPDGAINAGGASGLRLALGGWIDRAQTIGVQAGYIQLGEQDASFYAASDANGNLILARPFNRFNAGVPDPGAQLVSFPGVFAGEIGVSDRTTFNGFDFAVRANLCCDSCWRIDGLIGYRHLRFADRLQIITAQTALAGAAARGILPGTQIVGSEYFNTTNDFNGLDAGVVGEYRFGNVSLSGLVKAAYGYNWAVSDVNGITLTTVNGVTAANQGNLLALSSNIRTVGRYKGTLVPEIGLNTGWDVTSNVRLKLGYSLIYFDRVFRTSGQIDDNINTNLIPPAIAGGPANPAPILQQTSVLLHGINAGIELRY